MRVPKTIRSFVTVQMTTGPISPRVRTWLTAIICVAAPLSIASSQPPVRDTVVDPSAPLGSSTNPVLANGPSGEREFLARLRCEDGKVPDVLGRGSSGGGAHGHIIDTYTLRCGATGSTQSLFMDMYHGPEREKRAVPGFSVLAEHPARLATGCPPQVVPNADSSARYVFIWYEVEKSAKLQAPVPQSVPGRAVGVLSVGYVIDTTGAIAPGSVRFSQEDDTVAVNAARQILNSVRFVPAEHHAGCKVRQFSGGNFTVQPSESKPLR